MCELWAGPSKRSDIEPSFRLSKSAGRLIFRFSDSDECRRLFVEAGFVDGTVQPSISPWRSRDLAA